MARNRKLQRLQTTNMIADGNATATAGQMTMMYQLQTEGAATETVTLVVDRKVMITDVKVILMADGGANGNAVQLKLGAALGDINITDSMVIGTAGVNDVVREGELGVAKEVGAGSTLKLVATDAGSNDIPAVTILISAVPML